EPRRLGQSFAELPEEKQKSVGLRLVVPEGGVAGGQAAAIDRAPHQRQPRVTVPRLGGRGRRNDETDGERGTHDGERQRTQRGGTASAASSAGRGAAGGRRRARRTIRSATSLSACAGCRRSRCRTCRGSPAARSAISVTTSSGRSSASRGVPPIRSVFPTPS